MLSFQVQNRNRPNRAIDKIGSCSVNREAYAILPIYTISSPVNLNLVIYDDLFVFLRIIADPIIITTNLIGVTEEDGVRADRLLLT